ncbi:MAG: hypothetical protein IT348_07900 [Candidatus Eisenbacteria bacterium]|nr:hypothetical protein [Candidatus Eisenbacteria bacterium]
MSGETAFWDAVDALREREVRYAREAYGFVVGALSATVQALPEERRADTARRHLSGGELVDGIIGMAREEFGAMAPTVFREWGVLSSEDVGRIVFQLVECGQLSAREEDTMADFRSRCDLLESLAHVPDFGRRGPGGNPAPPA